MKNAAPNMLKEGAFFYGFTFSINHWPHWETVSKIRKEFFIVFQCRPIGNMHKTIDFIGDLKSDGCFKWHTPSHGVQKCQKAFIFGGFQAFSMGRLCLWFGIVAALFVRFFSHFMLIHGWGKGVSNYEINAFKNTTDHEKYLFVVVSQARAGG